MVHARMELHLFQVLLSNSFRLAGRTPRINERQFYIFEGMSRREERIERQNRSVHYEHVLIFLAKDFPTSWPS